MTIIEQNSVKVCSRKCIICHYVDNFQEYKSITLSFPQPVDNSLFKFCTRLSTGSYVILMQKGCDMLDIKPIETQYKGYRFRSRLEAKWAVYFDLLNVIYEYEPQGYVLPSNECYLPDFYLPAYDAYVEIKPLSIGKEDYKTAKRKLRQLVMSKESYGIICRGDPLDNKMRIVGTVVQEDSKSIHWLPAEFILGPCVLDDYRFTVKRVCGLGIAVGDRYEPKPFTFCKFGDISDDEVLPFNTVFSFDRIPRDEQTIARGARFEHGECG